MPGPGMHRSPGINSTTLRSDYHGPVREMRTRGSQSGEHLAKVRVVEPSLSEDQAAGKHPATFSGPYDSYPSGAFLLPHRLRIPGPPSLPSWAQMSLPLPLLTTSHGSPHPPHLGPLGLSLLPLILSLQG